MAQVYVAEIHKRDGNPFYEVHVFRNWTAEELAARGHGQFCQPRKVMVGVLTGFPRKDAEHLRDFIASQADGKGEMYESESDGSDW